MFREVAHSRVTVAQDGPGNFESCQDIPILKDHSVVLPLPLPVGSLCYLHGS